MKPWQINAAAGLFLAGLLALAWFLDPFLGLSEIAKKIDDAGTTGDTIGGSPFDLWPVLLPIVVILGAVGLVMTAWKARGWECEACGHFSSRMAVLCGNCGHTAEARVIKEGDET